MKVCARCKIEKATNEYQRDPRNTDGLRNVCRGCRTAQHHIWLASQPANRLRAYSRKWARANPDRVAKRVRTWRGKNRERTQAQTNRFRVKHRDRWLATASVYKAVKSGRLVRPTSCERCGKKCRPQAHHHDYTKRLDVSWVCSKCHRALDNLRRTTEALVAGVALMALGHAMAEAEA